MLAPEVRRGDNAHEYGTEGMGRRGDDDEGMGRSVGCVACGAGLQERITPHVSTDGCELLRVTE
jgi:hypothetical protein